MYLSKSPIGVSGKIRLSSPLKISTLTMPELDSGDSLEGQEHEGEEGKEDCDEEKSREEEEEITPARIPRFGDSYA
jgi:hypothetical protein